MSTVDEILATGQYTDRRGREWVKHTYLHGSVEWLHFVTGGTYTSRPDQMRLLIERDQHVCPGLRLCCSHPVPNVLALQDDISGAKWGHGFGVYRPGLGVDREAWVDTLPEAMSAARALAVGE